MIDCILIIYKNVTSCEDHLPLEAMVVFAFAFCCCGKCHDQQQPGKGRTLSYRLPSIIKGSQGRNFREELKGEAMYE